MFTYTPSYAHISDYIYYIGSGKGNLWYLLPTLLVSADLLEI